MPSAAFTLISTRETTLHKIKDHDDGFTYFKIELGPDNLAALAAVRGEDGDSDLYSSIKTKRFFDNWIYGFVEDGMDFNPDSFVIPEDKITRNGMSAAITIGFSDREDGDTTLFVTQFVALEKPKPGAADLYTMIVRTYSDDAMTLAQLQPSRGDEHTCYDPHEPHFHTIPSTKVASKLGSAATQEQHGDVVVEVYLWFPGLSAIIAGAVVGGEAAGAAGGGDRRG